MVTLANVIFACGLMFLTVSGVALAQDGNAGAPTYSGAAAINPNTIDDATLKHTAKAHVKVRDQDEPAHQALSSTNDNTRQQQIAKQAEANKIAAVQAEDVKPQQYHQVLQLARVDQAFRQKFLAYVNQVKSSSR